MSTTNGRAIYKKILTEKIFDTMERCVLAARQLGLNVHEVRESNIKVLRGVADSCPELDENGEVIEPKR